MTIEISIITANKHVSHWLRQIAKFTENLPPPNDRRKVYVKITFESDC